MYLLLPVSLSFYFLPLNMLLRRPILQKRFSRLQSTFHLQNQPPEVSIKKAAALLKTRLLRKCFPVNFAKFLRTLSVAASSFGKHLFKNNFKDTRTSPCRGIFSTLSSIYEGALMSRSRYSQGKT